MLDKLSEEHNEKLESDKRIRQEQSQHNKELLKKLIDFEKQKHDQERRERDEERRLRDKERQQLFYFMLLQKQMMDKMMHNISSLVSGKTQNDKK